VCLRVERELHFRSRSLGPIFEIQENILADSFILLEGLFRVVFLLVFFVVCFFFLPRS